MWKYKFGVAFISLGLVMMAAALLLVGYNMWDDDRAEKSVKRVRVQIAQHLMSDSAEEDPTQPDEEDPDFALDPERDMPIVEIEDHKYIGTLKIPVLELELPVISDWSYPNLKVSPCRYVGSAYLDNMIICAHNYNSHFGRIKNLQDGDEVRFTDMDGHVFLYAVREVEILQPTAIEQMESGDWALSLFTCTIGGRTRVTVRCDKVEE